MKWLVLACTLLFLLPALAAPESRRVVVRIAAGEAEAAAQRDALAAVLDGLDVELEVERVAAIAPAEALRPDEQAAPALARVWLDASREGEVLLLLTDGGWRRFLVRTLPRQLADSSGAELRREQVAQIVVTAVETLLAGELIGAPREQVAAELQIAPPPVPPPPPAPPPPPPAPRRVDEPPRPPPVVAEPVAWRLRGALFYEGQGYAAEQVIIHGPGAALAIDAAALPLAPSLELSGQYRLPFEAAGEALGFELQSGALRLLCMLQVLQHEAVALHAGVGAGIDILDIEPELVAGLADPSPARVRVAPLVRAALALRLRLFGELGLLLGFAGDLDVIGTRYVVLDRGVEVPLVEPLRFRPTFSIGLSATLGGAPLFGP